MTLLQHLFAVGLLVLNSGLADAIATCPANNGQYVQSQAGTDFKVKCNFKTPTQELSRQKRLNFQGCIDLCSYTSGCLAVDYTSDKWCILHSAAAPGTTAASGTHNAYREDNPANAPPADTQPPPNEPPINQPPADQTPINPPPAAVPGPSPGQANLQLVANPTCPEDNGRGFVAPDGTHYKIECNRHAGGNNIATYQNVGTFNECMTKCSETNGCISAQFIPETAPSGYTANECVLSDGEGPGIRNCAHWFAYTVPPPATADETPFPHTQCTTTCPFADGLIYESDFGESFKMSCSKRHGSTVLWTQPSETFDDCMNTCGQVVACHSVDYQARTKKCYLLGGHGAPSIQASSFASATSIGCAGACKKSRGCGGCGSDSSSGSTA